MSLPGTSSGLSWSAPTLLGGWAFEISAEEPVSTREKLVKFGTHWPVPNDIGCISVLAAPSQKALP